MEPDALILVGHSVKALGGDGDRFGGYLVVWGSPDDTDKSSFRDYFTPDTDFGPHDSTDVLYNHGLDPEFGPVPIGSAKMAKDDRGVWIEGKLALREKYLARHGDRFGAIKELVRAEKLGLSSGTLPGRMQRERQPNGSNKILSWPLGLDASLTETPAEPKTFILSMKSLVGGDPGAGSFAATLRRLGADAAGAVAEARKRIDLRAAEGRTVSPDVLDALKAQRDALDELVSLITPTEPAVADVDPALIARIEANVRRWSA